MGYNSLLETAIFGVAVDVRSGHRRDDTGEAAMFLIIAVERWRAA